MPRGLFITGTDTSVGKTVVAAGLMHRYRPQFPLRYWKPIQTGVEQDDDTGVVRTLGSCAPHELFDRGYRIQRPLSPHLAARLSDTRIRISEVESWLAGEADTARWLIEGAGGVLVPINDWEMMIDIMVHFSMPVLVVARSILGTINHTLLTLDAVRSRGVEVAGVVMVGDKNSENREAIERFGRVHVLGEMPRLEHLTTETVGRWALQELDKEGRLAALLS
jgi:dethiobiotin synthase